MCSNMNTCPVCECDAKIMTWRHNHHDVFQCTSMYCGVVFEETGLGQELLPAEFETGEIYGIYAWSDAAGDTKIEIEVIGRNKNRLSCFVNDITIHDFIIHKEEGVEYITLGDLGFEDCIYASCQILPSDKQTV